MGTQLMKKGPILSHINPFLTLSLYLAKMSFNIFLGHPSCLFPSSFLTKILYAFLISPIRDF